jgi:hypothetical protein
MDPAAPAAHPVLVILGELDRHHRDLVLLIALDDPQVQGIREIMTTLAPALGKPIPTLIRDLSPRQIRPQRPRLLTPGPHRPLTTALRLLRRRCPTQLTVLRRRARGVRAIPREQMLHPRQPARQRLVRFPQLRDLPSLTPHQHNQLITRHLLRDNHPKIKLHPTPQR